MPQRWIAKEYGSPDKLELEEFKSVPAAPGRVVIDVKASGMNPVDVKLLAGGPGHEPVPALTFGFEVAGVIKDIDANTSIATGSAQIGDAVIAYQIADGYATEVNVSASDVFTKPSRLSFPEAANLLLASVTAAELLYRAAVKAGDVVLVHGASGSVGGSAVQQARLLGARVIGTSGQDSFQRLEALGAEPVLYGPGLEDRINAIAPGGIDVALDTVGSDEAVQVSLKLIHNKNRFVTIAAEKAANQNGFLFIGSGVPGSAEYRSASRTRLIDLAARGKLTVNLAQTFAFSEAAAAMTLLSGQHPGGKLALIP